MNNWTPQQRIRLGILFVAFFVGMQILREFVRATYGPDAYRLVFTVIYPLGIIAAVWLLYGWGKVTGTKRINAEFAVVVSATLVALAALASSNSPFAFPLVLVLVVAVWGYFWSARRR